jgi:hypothetical protein
LVRFLARVAEYSSENKMTASNLGICIGCSILYPKEQVSNSSISNSFTNGSTILELMIIHHKQFFPSSSQQDLKTFKSQPDIIPTEFHPVKFYYFIFLINLCFRKAEVVQVKIY